MHDTVRIPALKIKDARSNKFGKALYAWAVLRCQRPPIGQASSQRYLTGPYLAELLGVSTKTAYRRIDAMKEHRLIFPSRKIKNQVVMASGEQMHRDSCANFGINPDLARRVTREEFKTKSWDKLRAKTYSTLSVPVRDILKGEKHFLMMLDSALLEINLLHQSFKERNGRSIAQETFSKTQKLSGKMSCKKFGKLTGCSKSTASRRLRSIEKNGHVSVDRKRVWLDPEFIGMDTKAVEAFFAAKGVHEFFRLPGGGGFAAQKANEFTFPERIINMYRGKLKN